MPDVLLCVLRFGSLAAIKAIRWIVRIRDVDDSDAIVVVWRDALV